LRGNSLEYQQLISETRRRLKEWGTWTAESEPSLASMFRSIFNGRGAQDLRELPQHIAEVDHIVCTSQPEIRITLIKFYGTRGTYYEKAIALGVDKRTLKRRIDRADYYVHSILDRLPQKDYQVAQATPSSLKDPRSHSPSLNLEPA
jgi:hypothetical protein